MTIGKTTRLATRGKTAAAVPAPVAAENKANTLTLPGAPPATAAQREAQVAEVAACPIVTGAIAASRFMGGLVGEVDLTASVKVLRDRIDRVHGGDLYDVEAMLMAQAGTLNVMFCELARRAALNMTQEPEIAERYFRLAFKAQNQGRATLETVAVVKSPPTVFARQANITNGPQQVNNTLAEAGSRAEIRESAPNELLEGYVERVDTGTAGTPVARHQAVAALATVHRTPNA